MHRIAIAETLECKLEDPNKCGDTAHPDKPLKKRLDLFSIIEPINSEQSYSERGRQRKESPSRACRLGERKCPIHPGRE